MRAKCRDGVWSSKPPVCTGQSGFAIFYLRKPTLALFYLLKTYIFPLFYLLKTYCSHFFLLTNYFFYIISCLCLCLFLSHFLISYSLSDLLLTHLFSISVFHPSPFRLSPFSAEPVYLCRLYLGYYSIQIKFSKGKKYTNCLKKLLAAAKTAYPLTATPKDGDLIFLVLYIKSNNFFPQQMGE